jgi:hypothetical protein
MKFKKYTKKYSTISIERGVATKIRKIASNRQVPVNVLVEQMFVEWSNWKEPEKVIDKHFETEYN